MHVLSLVPALPVGFRAASSRGTMSDGTAGYRLLGQRRGYVRRGCYSAGGSVAAAGGKQTTIKREEVA